MIVTYTSAQQIDDSGNRDPVLPFSNSLKLVVLCDFCESMQKIKSSRARSLRCAELDQLKNQPVVKQIRAVVILLHNLSEWSDLRV